MSDPTLARIRAATCQDSPIRDRDLHVTRIADVADQAKARVENALLDDLARQTRIAIEEARARRLPWLENTAELSTRER